MSTEERIEQLTEGFNAIPVDQRPESVPEHESDLRQYFENMSQDPGKLDACEKWLEDYISASKPDMG